MPMVCEPCPGKRNAILIDIAEIILPDEGGQSAIEAILYAHYERGDSFENARL
jgi:hypothetical protein